jgi:hypothetical protein
MSASTWSIINKGLYYINQLVSTPENAGLYTMAASCAYNNVQLSELGAQTNEGQAKEEWLKFTPGGSIPAKVDIEQEKQRVQQKHEGQSIDARTESLTNVLFDVMIGGVQTIDSMKKVSGWVNAGGYMILITDNLKDDKALLMKTLDMLCMFNRCDELKVIIACIDVENNNTTWSIVREYLLEVIHNTKDYAPESKTGLFLHNIVALKLIDNDSIQYFFQTLCYGIHTCTLWQQFDHRQVLLNKVSQQNAQ